MDTWKFAHEYVGKLWWKIGWILIILTILAHIPFYGSGDNTLGIFSAIVVVIQIVLLCGSILPTEIALKRSFNKDGTRR